LTYGCQNPPCQSTTACGPWSIMLVEFPVAAFNPQPAPSTFSASITCEEPICSSTPCPTCDVAIYGSQTVTVPPGSSIEISGNFFQYGALTISANTSVIVTSAMEVSGELVVDTAMGTPIQVADHLTFFAGALVTAIVSTAPDPSVTQIVFDFVTFGTAGGCTPNCLVGFDNALPTEVIATFGGNKRDSSAGVLSADGQSQCVTQFGTPVLSQTTGSSLSMLLPVNTQCTPVPSINVGGTKSASTFPYWAIIVCAVGGFLVVAALFAIIVVIIKSVRKRRTVNGAVARIKDVQVQLERARTADSHREETLIAPTNETIAL